MRKFAIKKATPDKGDPEGAAKAASEGGWFREHWRLLTLFVIILAAFLIRFVFAYGISADDNYALSGGASATTNLRVITEILAGTFDPASQASLNYPLGAVNVHGPVFDYLMAGIASIITVFGISDVTAAAGALAWSAPIFGALTCVPVYLVGRTVSRGNGTVGVLSALFYAFFAITIMTTPFSNGTAFPLLCFLVAWLVYAVMRAFEEADRVSAAGVRAFISEEAVRKHAIAAATLFALIALTWTNYRMLVLCAAVMLLIGLSIRRITGREIGSVAGISAFVLLAGTAAAALYYVPMGMWDSVFSGACVLGVCTVVLTAAAALSEKKPWVLTLPIFVTAIVAIAAALWLAAPDLLDAAVHGNDIYTGSLMESLADSFTRTGIGAMASYYGWFTLWLPLMLGAWMLYRYRRDGGSRLYGFTILWLFSCSFVGWFSSDYAVVSGAGFAVGSAVVVYDVVKAVRLRKYLSSLKGNGIRGGAKKALKFFPLITIIGAVVLIVAPNAALAIDAATPTNDEKAGWCGGMGYTINTTDSSLMDSMWNSYEGRGKSGAMVTWYGYSDSAVSNGGFDSVTDAYGGGTSPMSRALLSTTSTGTVAVMALRLMLADGVAHYRSDINAAGLDYSLFEKYAGDPSKAIDYISKNPGKFPGISSGVTKENAVYLVLSEYVSSKLTSTEAHGFYDNVRKTSGKSITYVEVDGGMLPVYYGDGSVFSTLAYFGDYARDKYGVPNEFCTVNTSTKSYTYTNAMYETFLWKALLGISASDAGVGSSVALLNALAVSDGSVKAVPGTGLPGFNVSYWHVRYNPDSSATGTSSGWVDMDAYEAIALQKEKGGVINYLSSVVVLEYDPDDTSAVTGTASYGGQPAANIKVAVYEKLSYADGYVMRDYGFTKADGGYTLSVPHSGEYYVVAYAGATDSRNGTPVATYYNAVPAAIDIPAASASGYVVVGEEVFSGNGTLAITGTASGQKYEASVTAGAFSLANLLPDTYSATVYNTAGTQMGTSTLTVPAGASTGVQLSLNSGTISVSAKDQYGQSIGSAKFVAVETASGLTYRGDVANGAGTLAVPAGTYNVYLTGEYVSISSSTSSVTSGNTRSVTLVGYEAKERTVTGVPSGVTASVMGVGFNTVSSNGNVSVPSVGGVVGTYTVYAVSAGTVYYGILGSGVTSGQGYTVSGTLKHAGSSVAGTVVFIKDTGETFVFGTDADGKYTAVLPAGGYSINAYDSTSLAYLGKYTVSKDEDAGSIPLVDGRSVTARLVYSTRMSSPSSRGVAYADVEGKVNYGGNAYVLISKTNSDGRAIFWIPAGVELAATVHKEEFPPSSVFAVTEDFTGKSDASTRNATITTWTIAGIQSDSAKAYVKTVSVSSSVGAVSLTAYSDSKKTYTLPATVEPGQYTAKIKSGGYYYDGAVYIYPGNTSLDIDAKKVETVKINVSAEDVISVEGVKDDDGKTGTYYKGEDNTYYLQIGYGYLITASGKDGKVAYHSIGNATSTSTTIDMTSKSDKAEIKGSVGINGSGTITAAYGGKAITSAISKGEYTINVEAGNSVTLTAKVSATDSGSHRAYEFAGTRILAASQVTAAGATCNFASETVKTESQYEDVVAYGSVSGTFADGRGTLSFTVANTGKVAQTYLVTGGSAFTLERAYSVTVPAGGSAPVTVSGHYNADKTGYGDAGMCVNIATLSGASKAVVMVPASAFGTAASNVKVLLAGDEGGEPDNVNGYAYKYAVTVDNTANGLPAAVTVSASSAGTWAAYVTDSGGYEVFESSGHTFYAAAYKTSVFYVMLVNPEGKEVPVPGANISVQAGDTTKTVAASASTVNTEVIESDATGKDIEGKEKALSGTFWALLVVSVIVLLVMVWGGMRRGVFSRRK